jgi:DNA (cytosine-5)-methyltransferase 3A
MKIPDNFPLLIDAALVSAQRRKRLFWTNIPNVTLPEDRGILLKDILEIGIGEPVALRNRGQGKKPEYNGTGKANALTTVQTDSMVDTVYQYRRTYWRETKGGKVPTLTANMGTGGHNVPFIQQTARGYNKGGKKFDKVPTLTKNAWEHNHKLNNIRKLTPIECERLQCLPDNYTEGVSNTQRYKSLGNAFNVDVVAHILSFIPKK